MWNNSIYRISFYPPYFRANRQIIISIASIDHAEPYFNGKIVVSVLPPYKAQITISEEKLSSFKLWLNY